jgi:hypothetical protein
MIPRMRQEPIRGPRPPARAVTATARPPSSAGQRCLRFPCGHTEAEAAVASRLRERPGAVWVGCPRCNVIALTVGRINAQ